MQPPNETPYNISYMQITRVIIHTLYTASAWKSWTPCCAWQQFMRSVCYCATTGRGALFAWCTFHTRAANTYMFVRCSASTPSQSFLQIHYPHNLLPPPPPPTPSPASLPLSMSDRWVWDSSHLQCVIAASPPLLEKKKKKEGGIHQNCADSALSVGPFFIIRHTTLLSCQERQLNIWQLQGVQGKDGAQWAISRS